VLLALSSPLFIVIFQMATDRRVVFRSNPLSTVGEERKGMKPLFRAFLTLLAHWWKVPLSRFFVWLWLGEAKREAGGIPVLPPQL
jgi:hypothetical protein